MEVTAKTIELLRAALESDLRIEIIQTVVDDLRSTDAVVPVDRLIEGAIMDWDK